MNSTRRTLRLVGLIVFALTTVTTTAQAKTVNATIKTKSVTLKKGDKLVVKLDENGSTGFRWAHVKRPAVIAFVSSKLTGPSSVLPGAGGVRTFTYKAARTGTGTLKLEYRRSFSDEVAKTYTLKVKVKL